MAQAGPNLPRRSLFAAFLAAPIVTEPMALAKAAALRPGNVWVQVPAVAWTEFLKAASALEQLHPR